MSRELHIVASCTDGKRLEVPQRLRLRAHRARSIEDRFKKWWGALQEQREGVPLTPAEHLYIGDHWAVSRGLPAVAQAYGWRPRLWVLSAGYGLIPASAELRPYAATFQPGHEDSVVRQAGPERALEMKRWWQLLGNFAGPDPDAPRSVHALVHRSPSATVLIIASRHYLLALEEDLAAAQGVIRAPGALVIISTPAQGLRPEESCWVPSDARFQKAVGGSTLSIHARVGRWLIERSEQHGFQKEAVLQLVAEHLRRARRPRKPDREPSNDDVVKKFIRQQMALKDRATHSNLLRAWRSSGRACEQSRFRRLFLEVQGSER